VRMACRRYCCRICKDARGGSRANCLRACLWRVDRVFVAVVPSTIILWGIGAMIGAGGLDFWPIWVAAVIGAALGDWLSYWLGSYFHEAIARLWQLSRYPGLLPRGHAFFARWGALGVFISKFFWPASRCRLQPGFRRCLRSHFSSQIGRPRWPSPSWRSALAPLESDIDALDGLGSVLHDHKRAVCFANANRE
jgi:hypothetical protein